MTALLQREASRDPSVELGIKLLRQYGSIIPDSLVNAGNENEPRLVVEQTRLACGCDSEKDSRDGIRDVLFDSVSAGVTSVKIDERLCDDFQAAPLRISFRKTIDGEDVEFTCYLRTCEWQGRRVRVGYEVEVSG